MKALTVKQPWDYALLNGKRVENRPTRPPKSVIGERIALHAGLKYDYDGLAFIKDVLGKCETLEKGVIFATVRVVGWVEVGTDAARKLGEPVLSDPALAWALASPWFFGPIGIVLEELCPLRKPVSCRGMQGWWPVPAEIEQRVREMEVARG